MLSFADALDETAESRRYLLLGNGFSISLFPKCFSYDSLFEEARAAGCFEANPPLEGAFSALNTTDFELLMEALKASSKLGEVYGFNNKLMDEHSEVLKDILVEAIAGRHPSRPSDISENQYENSRAFLAEFIGLQREKKHQGKIFSLNYDLLLYWSLLHDIIEYDWSEKGITQTADQSLLHDDGFRSPEDNYEAEYVAWEQFEAAHSQSITFLHGALHLYEYGPELAKLCWERSGNKPLMDQIRGALDDGKYPLFVSEGSSSSKLAKINRSAYLSKGLRSFAQCCANASGSIFIIGHSLASNDDHVLKRIAKGKVGRMYVSLFGDYQSEPNKVIRAKAKSMASRRTERYPLEVKFIDASTLHIWDHSI